MTEDRDEDRPALSPGRTLVVLLIFAVATVLAVLLIRQLQESARMQDCLASGRTNCAPIEVPAR